MVHFVKGEAAGADAIILDDPDGTLLLTPQDIRTLCNRRYGIGADMVIRAVRTSATDFADRILAEESTAEWFLDAWDFSGTPMDTSSDGLRIYAHHLLQSGLGRHERGSTMAIATPIGVRDVFPGAQGYQVDLGRWRGSSDQVLVRTPGLEVPRPGMNITVGVPSTIVALASQHELMNLSLTEAVEISPAQTQTEVVGFVVPSEPLVSDGVGSISLRVHRAGMSEAPSSGDTAAAAALAVRYWAGDRAPDNWRVTMTGGSIAVRMFPTEDGEHVAVSGPARLTFRGEIELPSAP